MKNKHLFSTAIMAFAVFFSITACNKSTSLDSTEPASQEHLTLYLTDGPGLFDNVFIDIKSVKVLVDTTKDTRRNDNENWDNRGANDTKKDSSFIWVNLNIKAGVYDILKFRNGADTLLASTGIIKGAIRLIKIEIGTNNSLVKDSISYPVQLPLNALNYILIKLKGNECHEYLPGKKQLWLDFDITRSIIQGNNNQFYLKPVFHFYTVSTTGSIIGKVTPKDSYPVVTVYNEKDTAYALPNKDGYFKLRGLKNGTYSVLINASNGYADTTLKNIEVKAPKETSLGLITMRK